MLREMDATEGRQVLGQIKDIGLTLEGWGDSFDYLPPPGKHIEELTKLKDEQIDVTIKKYRERRSMSANDMLVFVP